MSKSIQKQGFDTWAARHSLTDLYGFRFFIIYLFIGAFILSYKYRGPLERLITMFLELQILSNLALLSITLPGNYIVMSSIMKPMVSLDFFRS